MKFLFLETLLQAMTSKLIASTIVNFRSFRQYGRAFGLRPKGPRECGGGPLLDGRASQKGAVRQIVLSWNTSA